MKTKKVAQSRAKPLTVAERAQLIKLLTTSYNYHRNRLAFLNAEPDLGMRKVTAEQRTGLLHMIRLAEQVLNTLGVQP